MAIYSVSEADERLPELVVRAMRGESITLSLEGTPVVEMKAVAPAYIMTDADLEWLRKRRLPYRQGFETPTETLIALRDTY